MTHILADRAYPAHIKQRVERTNHRYRQALDELRARQRPGGITPEEFDTIRSLSRQSWFSECDEQDPYKSGFQTTYSSFHHHRKEPDLDGAKCRLKSRPASPTRKNNPQPPSKVVTLRMKEAPGFEHNSASLPQGAYKVGQRSPKEAIYTEKRLYNSAPTQTQAGRWNDGGRETEVSVYRWLKHCGVEEQEASRRITKKLEKKSIFSPEVNAKYIGKQNPNRYYLGRYGGDKITDTTYKAAVDRLWYREPLKTSYLLK